MLKSRVLFIFTGSIACFKAVQVVSQLVKMNVDVDCILTSSALKFIGVATLEGITQRKVYTDIFESGTSMAHINLVRNLDLIIVVPATADYINKISNGVANDLASTVFLAYDFKVPFLIAPAMNASMYHHPITQASLKKLTQIGIKILPTEKGILACGEFGWGKLLDPEEILAEIKKYLVKNPPTSKTILRSSTTIPNVPAAKEHAFLRKKILVTGGGTVEKIDSVRSITNTSSGKTSFKLSKYLCDLGFDVTLIINSDSVKSSVSSLSNNLSENLSGSLVGSVVENLKILTFQTFEEINKLLKEELSRSHYDFLFHGAAISDYQVKKVMQNNKTINPSQKISSGNNLKLFLTPRKKIISQLKSYSKNKSVTVIGFKLTSSNDKKTIRDSVNSVFNNPNVRFVIHNDTHEIKKKENFHPFNIYLAPPKNSKDKPLRADDIDELFSLITHHILLGVPL